MSFYGAVLCCFYSFLWLWFLRFKKSPSTSVTKMNSPTMFFCEAQEMF